MSEKSKYRNISQKGDYTTDDLDCALECLMESEEIKKNKELMKLIEKRASEKEGLIRSVQDMRAAATRLQEEDQEEEQESSQGIKSLSDLKAVKEKKAEQD